MEHLVGFYKDLALRSNEERIAFLRTSNSFWIRTPVFDEIAKKITADLSVKQHYEQKGIFIYGGTGCGKTALLEELKDGVLSGYTGVNIVLRETFEGAEFKKVIMNSLGFDQDYRSGGKRLLPAEVESMIIDMGLVYMTMDELNDILRWPSNERGQFYSLLKYLQSPPLSVYLICLGTDGAHSLLKQDESVFRRFDVRHIGYWVEDNNFRSFIAGVECCLPLRVKSNLDAEKTIRLILKLSEGKTYRVIELLRRASIMAIESGDEKIGLKILEFVAAG